MRMLAKALALAGTTGTALVGAATPAAAAVCPEPPGICFVTEPFTVPVGTPAIGPVGTGPFVVQGPRLCDTSTGQCRDTYVVLPGASVGAGGSTQSSVTIPSFGFSLGPDGVPTVYYGIPSLDPSSTGLPDVTVVATVAPIPVVIGDSRCAIVSPVTVGPLSVRGSTCLLTVTVAF